jgi:hypothetical protein
MKRVAIVLALICLLLGSSVFAADEDWKKLMAKTDWDLYSKNMVAALKTDNLGLQVSAMQQAIKYKDYINVDNAALNLVRIYRRHKDNRMRQLALVTLYSAKNDWAMGIVRRDFNFECCPHVKRLMAAMLFEKSKKNLVSEESDKIFASIYETPIEM